MTLQLLSLTPQDAGGLTDSDHRAAYIAAPRAADGHDFDPLVTLVRLIAR